MTKLTCCEIREKAEKVFNKIVGEIHKENQTPEAVFKVYESINHFYKELVNELLNSECKDCEEWLDELNGNIKCQ